MATIPANYSMTNDGIELMNYIRSVAGQDYKDRIPEATRDNLADIGKTILQYDALENEFLNALVNRIGLVMITSKVYQNPYKMFKKGMLNYGESIEEIFVNIIKAHQYDPADAEKTLFKRELPSVDAVFHRMNRKDFYPVTIEEDELSLAFTSPEGVTNLANKIIESMYTSNEYDEFLLFKNLVVNAIKNRALYPVVIPELTKENAHDIVKIIKKVSNDLTFMNNIYNQMAVMTVTPKTEQYLIIDTEFDALIDVDVLASAFNMDKVTFAGHKTLIDNFANQTGVHGIIVDKDWFMIFDKLMKFKDAENGKGLYWNYFLHVWQLWSVSPFANAIVLTTNETTVTGVTVEPSNPTLSVGSRTEFTATVAGTGDYPSSVVWSITGANDPDTYIDENTGVLYIGDNESGAPVVTATSVFDDTKSGTSTVTIG